MRKIISAASFEHSQEDIFISILLDCFWLKKHKPKTAQSFSDPFTERIKEFESSGLIRIIHGANDKQTKHLMPTQQLLHKLNQHMNLLRQISERHILLIEKP